MLYNLTKIKLQRIIMIEVHSNVLLECLSTLNYKASNCSVFSNYISHSFITYTQDSEEYIGK